MNRKSFIQSVLAVLPLAAVGTIDIDIDKEIEEVFPQATQTTKLPSWWGDVCQELHDVVHEPQEENDRG